MKYGVLFAILAVLLGVLGVAQRGWHLLWLWPALSFVVVALGYLRLGPKVYGKSPKGLLSPCTQFLLLPYLLYLWTVWYALRLVKREPAISKLTETIFIGRRLLSHELPDNIDHVVDLTCEFNEPRALRSVEYHSFQILDGFVPLACLGNPDPADMKVYCPTGKETFDDDETTEEAPSRGDRCEAA